MPLLCHCLKTIALVMEMECISAPASQKINILLTKLVKGVDIVLLHSNENG
jgi:hypothetical protein